jgi:hypothetical protein
VQEFGCWHTTARNDVRSYLGSNSRAKGTSEENKGAVLGNISSFGTYTVDETKKAFTVRFEGRHVSASGGDVQTQPFEIAGDELRVTNPAPAVGGPPSNVAYRRDN